MERGNITLKKIAAIIALSTHELIDYIKKLEDKIDLLLMQKKKTELLGDWIEEKEVIAITGLSRNTLLKLRQEGHITRSSIAGKRNYYKASDFKKLMSKNEKEN